MYWVLFFHAFLAASLVPFSSEATMWYVLKAGGDVFSVFWVVSVGNVLGSVFTYALGRILPLEHRMMRRLGYGSKYWNKAERWVQKYGVGMAFFCWLPVLGDLIALAAGLFKLNWKSFIPIMACGKFLRYAGIIFLFQEYGY